jgi:LuxR family maltose regulon positive regulatory protein
VLLRDADRPGAVAPPFPLFESKLRPIVLGSAPRSRLVERLVTGQRTPVVVIAAPGGYGKSTLAAEWARRDRRPAGWYAVDEPDDDPVVFLTYLAAAMGSCGVDVTRPVRHLATRRVDVERVVVELGHSLAAVDTPALVVVDDVHLLQGRKCLAAVAAVLDRIPSGTQFVLVSRRSLVRPLRRLGMQQRVLELGVAEMSMNDAEAAELMRAAGLELTDDQAREVNARCEGWPTGLYLIALAGRAAVRRLCDGGTRGVDRFIADYFQLEMLEKLSPGDRKFLLEISVFDRFSAALCDVLLERSDSTKRLTALAEWNPFLIPLEDGDGTSFRFHPLFRDMLRDRLERRDPERWRRLVVRAGDAYLASGQTEAAVESALRVSDRERVAALVPAAALQTFWTGRAATVERWLNGIDDPEVLAAHPAAAVIGAGLLAGMGKPQTGERWARIAIAGDPEQTMPDDSTAAAWHASLRSLLLFDGLLEMRDAAETALTTLAPQSPVRPSQHVALSFAHLLSGDEVAAEESFEQAVEVALAAGAHNGALVSLSVLSLLASKRAELERAATFLQRARALAEQSGLERQLEGAFVHTAAARLSLAFGDRSSAAGAAAAADELLSRHPYGFAALAVFVRLELAQVHLALNEPASARRLLDDVDEMAKVVPVAALIAPDRVKALRRELGAGRSKENGWVSLLTPAELRLLPLLAGHYTFREIAAVLDVSRNTLRTQSSSIYRKLEVSSRSAAVERARELGLLRAD